MGVADIPWRTGGTVGRTIYRGPGDDDLCGMMDTRDLAAQVVSALHAAQEFWGRREVYRSDIVTTDHGPIRLVLYEIPED